MGEQQIDACHSQLACSCGISFGLVRGQRLRANIKVVTPMPEACHSSHLREAACVDALGSLLHEAAVQHHHCVRVAPRWLRTVHWRGQLPGARGFSYRAPSLRAHPTTVTPDTPW